MLCRYAECHYAEGRYAQCQYAEFHCAECHYGVAHCLPAKLKTFFQVKNEPTYYGN